MPSGIGEHLSATAPHMRRASPRSPSEPIWLCASHGKNPSSGSREHINGGRPDEISGLTRQPNASISLTNKLVELSTRGFTLIELLVVLAVLATLAHLALPVAQTTVQRHKEQVLREALREIRVALDQYHSAAMAGRIKRTVEQSGYPPNLQILVEGVPDQSDPEKKRRLYFLRRVPRDPFAATQLGDEATWGLRSYASAPDAPESGDDVYDVYSRSAGMGLNGVAHRKW